jgi:ribosome-associated protein
VSEPRHQPSPAVLAVRGSIGIPRAELTWRFSRSSGPGGQSVNTADSRVDLRWDLAASTALPEPLKQRALRRLAGRLLDGVLIVTAEEHRAQLRNRKAAETRLVDLIRTAIAPEPAKRRATKPSRGAVEARLNAKRLRSRTKQQRMRPAE